MAHNNPPVGSLPSEVADDIPAMISEGEFMLPADVVRYHGLDKIRSLMQEAKVGLACMEQEGLIIDVDAEGKPEKKDTAVLETIIVEKVDEPMVKKLKMQEGGMPDEMMPMMEDEVLPEAMPVEEPMEPMPEEEPAAQESPVISAPLLQEFDNIQHILAYLNEDEIAALTTSGLGVNEDGSPKLSPEGIPVFQSDDDSVAVQMELEEKNKRFPVTLPSKPKIGPLQQAILDAFNQPDYKTFAAKRLEKLRGNPRYSAKGGGYVTPMDKQMSGLFGNKVKLEEGGSVDETPWHEKTPVNPMTGDKKAELNKRIKEQEYYDSVVDYLDGVYQTTDDQGDPRLEFKATSQAYSNLSGYKPRANEIGKKLDSSRSGDVAAKLATDIFGKAFERGFYENTDMAGYDKITKMLTGNIFKMIPNLDQEKLLQTMVDKGIEPTKEGRQSFAQQMAGGFLDNFNNVLEDVKKSGPLTAEQQDALGTYSIEGDNAFGRAFNYAFHGIPEDDEGNLPPGVSMKGDSKATGGLKGLANMFQGIAPMVGAQVWNLYSNPLGTDKGGPVGGSVYGQSDDTGPYGIPDPSNPFQSHGSMHDDSTR